MVNYTKKNNKKKDLNVPSSAHIGMHTDRKRWDPQSELIRLDYFMNSISPCGLNQPGQKKKKKVFYSNVLPKYLMWS